MKNGLWIVLTCAIACVFCATVVAADNSISVDDYGIGGGQGDLLLELDFTAGESVDVDIDVSANDNVDIYFIRSTELARVIEGDTFWSYVDYTSKGTQAFTKSFTLSRSGWGGATYYYFISPSELTAEVDVEFSAIVDYDDDGYTGNLDPNTFTDENMLNQIAARLSDMDDVDIALETSLEGIQSDLAQLEDDLANISDTDLILSRLDAIEQRLDDIESNVSKVQSDLQDQANTVDENQRTAQDEADSARNAGIAVGVVAILLALIALIIAARGRTKETPYTPPPPEPGPQEAPVKVEEELMPEPIREQPSAPPTPLEPVKEVPVAPPTPPAPEPAPAPMAPPPLTPSGPEPAPAPMASPPLAPPGPEPAPAPMAPPTPSPAAEPTIPSSPTPAVVQGPRFCQGCGTKLDIGAKFCPKCGTSV